MKKLIFILLTVLFITAFVTATYNYRTIYNPFTGKLDFHISSNMSGENITADWFFGSVNASSIQNDDWISWAEAVNGTLAEMSDILAFNYYNSTDFDINDYLTSAEVLGFNYYNLTDFNINNYYLKSNPFGFYNATNPSPETLWNANYSTFLTHITWANAVNGTLYLASNPSGFIDWGEAINGTLLLSSQESNLNVNQSDWWITYNEATDLNELLTLREANITDLQDYILWSNAVNGTLMLQSTWNANYTANNDNWLLDTGILWGDAVNGTLAINSSIGDYVRAQDIIFNTTMGTYVLAKNDTMGVYVRAKNDTMGEYVNSKLNTTFFNATNVNPVTGTPTGTVADLRHKNDISYNVSEVSSDFELIINFTSIVEFNQIIYRYKSSATESHMILVQVWEYSTSEWENFDAIGNTENEYIIRTETMYDPENHVGTGDSDGVVQLRFYSNNAGGSTHLHQFDWVAISSGPATPSSTETDPHAIHSDGMVSFEANWDQGAFNFTNPSSVFYGTINASNITRENWIESSSESTLNVNSSNWLDTSTHGTIQGFNATEFTENIEGTLTILLSWLVGIIQDESIASLVEDTTPQLGGYLDTNTKDIGSTSDEIENIYVGVNTRIYFGDAQEASIYYNGTVLIIG